MAKVPYEQTHRMAIPFQRIAYDVEGFDAFLRSHGVALVHYRAIRCPVGLVELGDYRRPHEDHTGCNHGFVYKKMGTATGSFVNNPDTAEIKQQGWTDGSTVGATFPRFYDDALTPLHLLPFDRFYIDDESIRVPHWHMFTAHATGQDRMQFPIEQMELVMDSKGIEYTSNDFSVKQGVLVWGAKRPEPGMVCTAWYLYRPYWYISRLIHEVRVTRIEDAIGNSRLERMPQQVLLTREYVFMSQDRDEQRVTARQVPAAEDGSLGVR